MFSRLGAHRILTSEGFNPDFLIMSIIAPTSLRKNTASRDWIMFSPTLMTGELSDFNTYKEIVDTLIHEGRHAYQDYNVNENEIHPRHSEVVSWAETMEGGKWGYWGDCSTLLGQRLYDQQSIEIDARNFARDVLDKLNLNA